MRDGVSHLCHTASENVARPAGLEPATPGLEVAPSDAHTNTLRGNPNVCE
jgi:hypothetical protein